MAEPADSVVTLRFDDLGLELNKFLSYELDSQYLTSTDGWTFEYYEPRPSEMRKLRDIEMQPVTILVNGHPQVVGRVDITEIGQDASVLRIQGRDYIADIVECNVDPVSKLTEQMTLDTALTYLLAPCGITKIQDPDDAGVQSLRAGKALRIKGAKKKKGKKLTDYKPEPGVGVYELANKIAARYSATLQPDIKRDSIILDTPNYTAEPPYKIRRTRDSALASANMVLSASARRDYSKMPTIALFTTKNARSGESGTSLAQSFDMQTLATAFGGELKDKLTRVAPGTDKAARRKPGTNLEPLNGKLYRLLYMRDDESRNADQLFSAAKRAIAERLKDTLNYRVTLRGHQDPVSGALWTVNTLVAVQDELCNVNENLWIASRRFSASPTQGAITELECWRPHSFELD
jgi:prophage tail gpP-like protein